MKNESQLHQKLLITGDTSPKEIIDYIFKLREQKGKEKEVLKVISESLVFGHDLVVNLLLEEALTYQHLYMNDSGNKKMILEMQKSVLKAGFYISKYTLTKWQSRYFRFLGRIEDYKNNFKKSISFYKKAIKYIEFDPEPFRSLELEAFLSFSIIMSGQYDRGLKMAKVIYNKFISTKVGKELRKKDYQTWAIWISGLTIRTINALVDQKVNFNKEEIKKWLKDTEKYISVKDNFSYRRQELKELKNKLKLN